MLKANKARAKVAARAVNAFMIDMRMTKGEEFDTIISDFLADLRHFCDLKKLNYHKLEMRGLFHYCCELTYKGDVTGQPEDKSRPKDSFTRALMALDENRIDREASRAMWKLEAADDLYAMLEEVANLTPDDEGDRIIFAEHGLMDKIRAVLDKADGAEYRKEKP